MMVIKAISKAKKWDEVSEFIKMKKGPVPNSFIAEMCYEYGNIPLAVEAIKKISD